MALTTNPSKYGLWSAQTRYANGNRVVLNGACPGEGRFEKNEAELAISSRLCAIFWYFEGYPNMAQIRLNVPNFLILL